MPSNTEVLKRGALVLGGLAVVLGAAFGASKVVPSAKEQDKARPSPSPSLPAPVPKGFKPFSDPVTGVFIAFPKDWHQFDHRAPDREVPLVAGPNETSLALVRVCKVPAPIPASEVGSLKQGFDALVRKTNPNIRQERPITLNGLSGFHYLYTFFDIARQQEGVHSHFFLVDGATIVQLVFESIPIEGFEPLAKTFDQISDSFRSTKGKGPISACAPR